MEERERERVRVVLRGGDKEREGKADRWEGTARGKAWQVSSSRQYFPLLFVEASVLEKKI